MRVFILAESLNGGIGRTVARDLGVFASRGISVTLASSSLPLGFPHDLDFRHIRVPETVFDFRAMLAARREVKKCLTEVGPARVYAHGLRALALAAPTRRVLTLTYHGAGALPDSSVLSRALRKSMLLIAPRFCESAFTVVPLRGWGWKLVWLDSPSVSVHGRSQAGVTQSGHLSLLWLGRVSAQKRIVDFLSMIEQLLERGVDVSAEIVGAIDPDQLSSIASFGALPISLHGEVSDVSAFLEKDCVLCMFSNFEGKTFVVEEALSFGLPVIASDLPGTRMLIPSAEGLVTSVDEATETAIRLADWKVRSAVGSRLRRDYLEIRSTHEDWATALDRQIREDLAIRKGEM